MARRTDRERGALRLDPRLIIGIVLIAGSTTGVWALVSGFDDSIEVYVARDTITAGSAIEIDDLAVESVRLGSSAGRYLLADESAGRRARRDPHGRRRRVRAEVGGRRGRSHRAVGRRRAQSRAGAEGALGG